MTPFSPVVDGEVLTAAPWQALAAGRARGVDLIIGHNRDECRLFTADTELPAGPMDAALRAFSPPSQRFPPKLGNDQKEGSKGGTGARDPPERQ